MRPSSGFTLTNGATPSGEYGGGVRCISTNAVVTNCVMIGNSAFSMGGGAYYGTLVNCVLSGNVVAPFSSTGSGGGAAYSVLINCLLTGNFVGYTGGAAAYCTLVNCTVVSNAAAAYDGSLLGGTTENSIVYYNFNYYTNAETGSGLVFSNCCLSFPVSASSGANNFTNPPLFANLAGGDYHLNPGSPCINAGSNSAITNQVDLDGNPRIVGGIVDLGAYEFQSPVKYVSIANPSPVAPFTNWTTAATRIQDAVDAANAGDCIVVSNGVYTTGGRILFGAMNNRVVLTNAVTLTSVSGPQFTSIVGGTYTRCVYLGSNAVISGFTITNGQTQYGDRTNDESGGGIWSQTGGVVSNCFIVGNTAWSDGGCGGGIYGGSIFNSTLTNNTAGYGGGAAFASAFNCLFASNSAPYSPPFGYGGGMYQGTASNCMFAANGWGYGVSGGAAYQSTLFNCTLNTNFATYGGAGAESSILYNCTLTGNRCSSLAGGCYQSTNYNCLFVNNSGNNGGGVFGGVSFSCIFTNNKAQIGGGAYNGALYNCLLTGNAAALGGGASIASLFNCTVSGNTATNEGAGTYGGTLCNSIVYGNTFPSGFPDNFYGGVFSNCCLFPMPASLPAGCFTNAPAFVNASGGDFHLQTNSPCINSGNNAYATNATDLDGNPRIAGGTVDIGAYEVQSPASVISYAWLQQYGLPMDGSADNLDSDGDGFSNWQEWRAGTNPTNSSSLLQMTSVEPASNFSGATITWQSVSGVNYFVQRGSDLSVQPIFSTIQSNIVGQAGTTSLTDTTATNNVPYFYRVGVQ